MFTGLFVCRPTPFMAIPYLSSFLLQPHLHTIVNRSMELALSAKEPYNYFLLLRALFRSIGGGSHDLLYQEFLPLLPNLLQGKIFAKFNSNFLRIFYLQNYTLETFWTVNGN